MKLFKCLPLLLLFSCSVDDDIEFISEINEINLIQTEIKYSYSNINNEYFSLNSVNNRLPYLFNDFVWDDFFPEDLAILDYNNDGYLDLIHANSDKQNSILGNRVRRSIKFYLGDDSGNLVEDFTNKDKFEGLIHSRKSIVGDWNGDGYMDVFFAGTGPDSQQPNYIPNEYPIMLVNDRNGSFIEYKFNGSYGMNDGYWHSVTSSDIDDDGKSEIILIQPKAHSTLESVIIEFENVTGNWNNGIVITPIDISLDDVQNKFTSESIDMNNDGTVELLLGGENSYEGSFVYDLNTHSKRVIPHKNDAIIDAVFFDVDLDGDLDIITSTHTTYFQGKIEIFRNDITSFIDVTNEYIDYNWDYQNHNMQWIQWLYLGDFNKDGIIELHTSDSRDFDDKKATDVWWFENGKFIKKT